MPTVLVIGDSCIDEYHYGEVNRISPEAPVPVFNYRSKVLKPGMADNVAENLKSLGCDVIVRTGKPSVKIRLIEERTKQQLVRIDHDITETPDDSIINDLELLSSVDAIVISDYNKGFVSYQTVAKLRQQFNGPIFVDTKKPDLQQFQNCFVKINEKEFADSVSQCDNLIVTQGNKGAQYNNTHFAAIPVEVADVCGAGDTFLAALCFWYLKTKSIPESIKYAIKASTITVQHVGVYAPKPEEII